MRLLIRKKGLSVILLATTANKMLTLNVIFVHFFCNFIVLLLLLCLKDEVQSFIVNITCIKSYYYYYQYYYCY